MSLVVGPLHLFAVLLIVSGADKIGAPGPSTKAMNAASLFGDRRLGTWAGRSLGVVEVAVGGAVVAFGGVASAIAMAAVFGGFGLFLVLLQRRAADVSCGCFGASDAPPGAIHILIDLAAASTAVVAALTAAPDLTLVVDEGIGVFVTHVVLVVTGALLVIAASSVLEDVNDKRRILRSP